MGRWSKSHDQRKGQWLINKIRFADDFIKIDYTKLGLERGKLQEDTIIEHKLWNMTNEDFEKIMEDYYK